MPVSFQNYAYSFLNDKGKRVFAPTDHTRDLADELVVLVRERFEIEPHYYHFTKGAHVAALHAHREHKFFARLDLKNFFYSVGRNRVKAALKQIGVPRAEYFARWSSVRNPYADEPRYSLPYGFPQSPLLATLVLRLSALGTALQHTSDGVYRSVYLDDIVVSGDDCDALDAAFEAIKLAVAASNFAVNDAKTRPPAPQIDLFNCDLSEGNSTVTAGRVATFYAQDPAAQSAVAFEAYRATVADGNT